MTTSGFRPAPWVIVPLLLLTLGGIWLAASGRHHWDEPSYLYAAAYQPVPEILGGQVQPSGIDHFMQGRILHVLLAKGVMSLAGSGMAGYRAFVALDLLLLAFSMALVYRILGALLPEVPERRFAVVLIVAAPVVLSFAFKTQPDTAALASALVATLALVRISLGGGIGSASIAVVALAIAALTKNQMAVLPAAGWVALCLVPFGTIDRRRLAVIGALSGAAAVALTVVALEALGIGLGDYLASYGELDDSTVPAVAKVVNVATEFGALWLLLPFALLSTRRRELAAFAIWFLLATAPFVFLLKSIEARHVAGNLVAAAALCALALEALAGCRWRWFARSQAARGAFGMLGALVLLASNALVLAIMPHRVIIPQMRAMLDQFDARYGIGGYVLLTAAGYTDFQLIRVLWPETDVWDASTDVIAVHEGVRDRRQALDEYLGGRYYDSVDQLRGVRKPIVYMGYRRTFGAENLHAILSAASPSLADRMLGKVSLADRLFTPATAWLWRSPDVSLEPLAVLGHYHAFEVKLAGLTP